MTDQEKQQMYKQLMELIVSGDERAVREFVLDNIASFPEDVQKEFVSEIFFNAVDEKAEQERAVHECIVKGTEMIRGLEQEKKKRENGHNSDTDTGNSS